MHKQLVNQCTIHLSLIPVTPILIKSGRQGADPTKADMEFVETYRDGEKTIYLPGSSLKGAIRAHAERIVRTVGSDHPCKEGLWAGDPSSKGLDNPNTHLSNWKDDYSNFFKRRNDREQRQFEQRLKTYRAGFKDSQRINNIDLAAALYHESCYVSKLFGSTFVASRIRIEDAYSTVPLVIEERNGVAIDRVLGSAANSALFNYQVCTNGKFATRIHLKNFSLAQLGLLGLVLRDLHEGWFAIGFGKSRGLGNVSVEYHSAIVQYPGCILQSNKVFALAGKKSWEPTQLLGAGEFLGKNNEYQFPYPDSQITSTAEQTTPIRAESSPMGFGVQMQWQEEQVKNLFAAAVESWKDVVQPQGVKR